MFLSFSSAFGNVLQTLPEALSKTCPSPGQIEKKNEYLTKEQVRKINESLEFRMEERGTLVIDFECKKNGKIENVAYLDSHIVRKESETVLIAVSSAGEITDIEVLQFDEPKDYMAPDLWLRQFERKTKTDMSNAKSVIGITGATLTNRSISRSVQKILAIHSVLKQ